MTRIYRIPTSQIDGNGSNDDNTSEIRPYGEIAFYIGDNNKLELLMFDGVRTHVNSKVLSKGTFYGGDADSSDGLNYDTIKLVPDEFLRREGSDQYLIIDPTTGEPGHIHIRAGGTIDQSTADLFLGGEKNYVRVSDFNDRVTISTDKGDGSTSTWTFIGDGSLTFPGGANIIGSEYSVNIVSGNDGSALYGDVNITTNNPFSTSTWSFGTMGELTLPSGGEITSNQITNEVFGTTTTSMTLVPGGATDPGQRLEIYSTIGGEGNHLHLTSGSTSTELYLGNDSQYVKLGSIGQIEVSAQSGLTMWGQGVMSNAYIVLPNNIDSSSTSVTIGNANGDVLIQAAETGDPSPKNWFFGRDGDLTVPGNIIPDTTLAYDLGSPTNRFRDIYLSGNTINLGTATISAIGGTVQLPVGSTLGGVPIGSITIVGSVTTSTSLPVSATSGEGYIVTDTGNLWVWDGAAFVDLGQVRGPQGEIGLSGASGFSGYSGAAGATGSTGESGYSGYSGYSGATGSTGESGFSGYSGQPSLASSGFSGYSGAAGSTGESGFSGYSGAAGSTGESGFSGYSGAAGSTGESGFSGYSGAAGSTGTSGFSGYSGAAGSTGLTGESGFSGYSGASGYSGISGFSGLIDNPYAGILTIANTTQSTSTTTGALQVAGGVGVSGKIWAEQLRQTSDNVVIGAQTGETNQSSYAVAIGRYAGQINQGLAGVAVGNQASESAQGSHSVAIGNSAGRLSQGTQAVAIGREAGETNQGINTVAIGLQAGENSQGQYAVAMGYFAGNTNQGINTVAIGNQAGQNNQGGDAIAIGRLAGQNTQTANSIILNASGAALNSSNAGFYVNPIRGDNTTSDTTYLLLENDITKELTTSSRITFTPSTGVLRLNTNTNATSTTTGALVVTGGVGIGQNLYVGGNINFSNGTTQTTAFVIGTAPLSSTSTGSAGTISYDSGYFYICTATNSWQRIAWDNTPW